MNETYFDELRRFNLDVQRIVPLAQDVELMNKRLKELQTECKGQVFQSTFFQTVWYG